MITKELAHTKKYVGPHTVGPKLVTVITSGYCDCVFHWHPFVLFKTQKNINTRGINTYRSVNWHTKASKPLFCIRDFHMCIFIISVTHLHMDEKGTRSNYPHIKEYQYSLTHLRSVGCVEDRLTAEKQQTNENRTLIKIWITEREWRVRKDLFFFGHEKEFRNLIALVNTLCHIQWRQTSFFSIALYLYIFAFFN